jgi:tetratricopeptide (TPR) repeat protein
MALIAGLQIYEVVMLVLGVILFFVLVTLLLKGREPLKLLPLFLVCAILIGWHSIKKITGPDNIEIDTNQMQTDVAALENDPTNAQARATLQSAYNVTKSQSSKDPNALTLTARAALALGDQKDALDRIGQALKVNPDFQPALDLQERVDAETKLPKLTTQVENNPTDPTAKAQLQQTISTIAKQPILNPGTLTNVAQAQTVLGNKSEALVNVNKALQINPSLTEALQVKTKLQ